jgi:hypothetical protein
MKKTNSMITIMAAFLLAGTLFFSCAFPGNADYGTLVIALPGGNTADGTGTAANSLLRFASESSKNRRSGDFLPCKLRSNRRFAEPINRGFCDTKWRKNLQVQQAPRAAVSGTFTSTLTCRVDCDGTGGRITRQGQAGASFSIPLNSGDWTITLTVLNAAGQTIGSGTATALIESGQTTTLEVSVSIDTGGNDITGFAITSPISAEGSIIPNSTTINVSVPLGTDLVDMNFTVTHTGVSISPSPGTPLDFSFPQTFTVTAENGQPKNYMIAVIPAITPPNGGTAVWPSTATWQSYGFSSELTQPSGTTVYIAAVSSGTLIMSLRNTSIAAFNNLVSQIEAQLGNTGITSSDSGFSVYEITYPYSGANYFLDLTHTDETLFLSIESDDPGRFTVWPDNSRWAALNLSGLTQPAGTTAADVTEMDSPAMLSVTLNTVDNTAYENLLNQIIALLGSPYYSIGSAADPSREAVFMITMSANTLMVSLEMDASYDEIVVIAVKY